MGRIGITLDDDRGLESDVSQHFGQCQFFCIVDMDGETIKSSQVVPNKAQHGGGGCRAVDELLRHKINYVIAGGMGMGAQEKFAAAGVKIFGYAGKAKDALNDFLKNTLGGLEACREHEGGCH
ncbi:MAG: NifB/NifX family molybdenum-iron cluster-binding protein [Candidatus Omnitrophica bacterium]|nr:NifB/NifX family molybdenum-iron cluster-binding protein [Candidatus Omnitrophota bacterium]MDD5670338.1 NifB/NifX family molybdenum-iron cluster-binding protein [Candidatus Omnitrophota bacterium]